ncbi:MAG: nucleotidyltransferase family protein [Candidatus Pacebacteria bacterium]|jgi:NDP-sugar pyrophosphorylase family protein|nr:nucleotidyltransferase family protein [Candidatus Paceibacterota bacterium]
MKAVIFAAGEGKRLHPLTIERPKPLVEVAGKPLIQHIWEVLPGGIDEVVVVVGYKREMLRDFLGEEFLGKKVTYVEQDEPRGTADALKLCKSHLENEEKFLLMYADDLHGKDGIARCAELDMALLVHYVDDPRSFGVVVLNADGTIRCIDEKPEHPKSNLAVTGVYVLTPEIFNYESTRVRNGEHYLTDMIEEYIRYNPMHVIESDFWVPIAYPHDIDRAEEILRGLPRAGK